MRVAFWPARPDIIWKPESAPQVPPGGPGGRDLPTGDIRERPVAAAEGVQQVHERQQGVTGRISLVKPETACAVEGEAQVAIAHLSSDDLAV